MQQYRNVLYIALVIGLLLTMTGCVFLRLLKVQRQLKDFDRYFQVEDQNELALICLEPVMLMKDITWLARAKPTIQTNSGAYVVWQYIFEKQYLMDTEKEGNFEISQTMFFEDGKLRKITYPQKLTSVLKREFVTHSLRSMGKGNVNKQQRSLSAAWDDQKAPKSVKIPTKPDVEKVFGKPYAIMRPSDSELTFYYKYALRPNPTEKLDKPRIVRLWFTFCPHDETLQTFKAKFSGLTTKIEFPDSSKNTILSHKNKK